MGIEPLEKVDPQLLWQLSDELRRVAEMMDGRHPGAAAAASPPISAEWVRSIIRARRVREHYLGSDIFGDPGWDMLLDLFAARLEGARVSVSSLCLAAAVPPTTALRWIKLLCDEGLIERVPDRTDGRRVLIAMKADTASKMQQALAAALRISRVSL